MNIKIDSLHRVLRVFAAVMLITSYAAFSSFVPTANADNEDVIVNTFPVDGEGYASVDSIITITFNVDIHTAATNLIKLFDTTTDTEVEVPTSVTANGKTLTVKPTDPLEYVHRYKVKVPQSEVLNSSNSSVLIEDYELSFDTDFYNFYTIMVENDPSKPNIFKLLHTENYTPRELKVYAPKRYINEVEVIHKRQGTVSASADEEDSEAVTNFDIKTSDQVDRVEIVIDNDDEHARSAKLLKASGSSKIFDLGFASLASDFDFEIKAYDKNDLLLDSHVERIADSDESITKFKKSYRYKTAGKGYTLYELISNVKNFQSLLGENAMDELKVQVVNRP